MKTITVKAARLLRHAASIVCGFVGGFCFLTSTPTLAFELWNRPMNHDPMRDQARIFVVGLFLFGVTWLLASAGFVSGRWKLGTVLLILGIVIVNLVSGER